MKKVAFVSVGLLIFGLQSQSGLADDFENYGNLCEVYAGDIRGLSDEDVFETVHAAWSRAVNEPGDQPTITIGNVHVESPDRCHAFRHTLGGYASQSESEIIMFRRYIEWRGGIAASRLILCRRTRQRLTGAPSGEVQTTYSCSEIAAN